MTATLAPHAIRPPAPSRAPSGPGYVLIPDALVADLANNLAAIGLYALVARRFLVSQAPVPLSAADAHRYDPALSPAAAGRALRRLAQQGWLLEAPSPGSKSAYTPTWGVVRGEARPWGMDEPRLGLPRRHTAQRLDRRLLDLYLGKLTPHPAHRAAVTRYLTRPLLSLADVGAYARALAGLSGDSPALVRLGLLRSGRAVPPSDDALARASQLALAMDAPALSDRGLRKLGLAPAQPTSTAQALFFVPAGVIGGDDGYQIGHLIGQAAADEAPPASSPRGKPAPTPLAARSTAILANEGTESDPPPSPPRGVAAPGGGVTDASHRGTKPGDAAAAASGESAALLRDLGVRESVARELADAPAEAVRDAAAQAQARPTVRDRAAWVVSALREARAHGWQLAPAVAAPQVTAPAALPSDLAALDVDALLARAQADAPAAPPVLPPADALCYCGGEGSYLLPVEYGHPLWGKLQPCACTHGANVASALARDAGPALAETDLAGIQVADRPYADVTWAGRAFSPAEQAATVCHAVAGAIAIAAAAPARGLTLVGPPGSGKTTLAVAAAKELAVRSRLDVRYASVPQLCDALRREASEHAPAALLEKLIAAPVLVLDDLGRERLTPFARVALYRLLDERMRRHTPETPRVTFVTSNLTVAQLYALDGALASRLAAHTQTALCVASDYRLHTAATNEGAAS
ncbi:MAG: hypothetical protein RLZZ387_2446 [Chloroflexota bacterium]|jgi:hypothetical protein